MLLLYHRHITSFFKIGDDLDNCSWYIARHIREVLAGTDCLEEGKEHIAQTFAIQLIEITLVVLRILVPYFEVIGFPPGSRHINISLGSRDDKRSFRLNSLPHLERGYGMRINERNLRKGIILLILVQEVSGYLLRGKTGSQQLEDRQKCRRTPCADTVPFVKALLRILSRIEIYQTCTGGIYRYDVANDASLRQ